MNARSTALCRDAMPRSRLSLSAGYSGMLQIGSKSPTARGSRQAG